jgi:tRNA nucleotidyltransferase (CCA-adding enzyme)
MAPADPPFPVHPAATRALETLWAAGHAAYLVGGAVRDGLIGRDTGDEPPDVATDARPEETQRLFPGSTYENRFGTVTVEGAEITTFRRDHQYGDHRRPDRVTFTDSLEEDLARRDYTINAIGWGRAAGATVADLVDPWDGRADLAARVLRAVGDPDARFDEDALRLVRGARIAAHLGLSVEAGTLAAMSRHAADVRFLAAERVGAELRRMLRASPPSAAFRILAETDILAPLFPELGAQVGVPQDKLPGQDLWDHCLATLDAVATLAPGRLDLLLAALLHDTGKPETFADGRFRGHAEAGARIAAGSLSRLAFPARDIARVTRLVRHHMFVYEPTWGDAAVRRFMRRVGVDLVDDLLLLRAADNVGSGWPAEAGGLEGLRSRIEEQRRSGAPLSLAELAVDGHDLMRHLGREPGPWLGALLDRLLDSVIAVPSRNTADRLLADARDWTSGDHADGRPSSG